MNIRGAKKDFKPGQKADRFGRKVVSPAKDSTQPAAPDSEAAASHPFPVVAVNCWHRRES
jgi:hypothetical protein